MMWSSDIEFGCGQKEICCIPLPVACGHVVTNANANDVWDYCVCAVIILMMVSNAWHDGTVAIDQFSLTTILMLDIG